MFLDLIKSVFNFSISNDEVEDELVYLYGLELKKETNDIEEKIKSENFYEMLYSTLSDNNYISDWCSIEKYNINRLLAKIDKKLAQLEDEEKVVDKYRENLNDNKQSETEYFDDSIHVWDVFKSHIPKEDFSDYYKLFFAITFLYRIAYQFEIDKYDQSSISHIIDTMINYRFNSFDGDQLVNEMVNFVINGNNDINSSFEGYNTIKYKSKNLLTKTSKKIFKSNQFLYIDKKLLLLVIQLHTFVQIFFDKSIEKKQALQNTLSDVSLAFAEFCRNEDKFEYGSKFASLAFLSSEVEIRWDAYNVSALCAIEENKHQLAYDIYFSWINQIFLESLSLAFGFKDDFALEADIKISNNTEKKWRKKHSSKVALIYGNFSYVCGMMYDNIEDSITKRRLIQLAEFYIKRAIELDPKSNSYYCSAGTIYSYMENHQKALEYYSKYKDLCIMSYDKLQALRHQILVYIDLILDSEENSYFLKSFDNITSEYVKQYNLCLQYIENKKIQEELTLGRDIYFLVSECEKVSNDIKNLKFLMFQIKAIINNILSNLKQISYANIKFELNIDRLSEDIRLILKEINASTFRTSKRRHNRLGTRTIAYYTSLKNLNYLLEEIPLANNPEKKMNSFTMMHAKYMNDPEEGLVLLRKLKDVLPEKPEYLRNELYDQKFVFIKSFTDLIDQLNMWTMYGSDISLGNDCNGCCVCIAKETFDMMTGDALFGGKQDKSAKLNSRFEDDFHLYSIAYMDEKNIYVNNKKNLEIKRSYSQLESLLKKLQLSQKTLSIKDSEIITNCIVRLLGEIMFLFKDFSYYMEGESRLIITRDVNDYDEIKTTAQTPPKLFINPPYQVYPEKIILGPKVEDVDYWMPHLQYELSKIRTKWVCNKDKEYKPVVRSSNINIR